MRHPETVLGAGFLKLTADSEACRSSGRYSTISPASGLIAQYNAATPMPGPDMFSVLRKRPTLRGFIVWDFAAKQDDFLREASDWVRSGRSAGPMINSA